MLHVNPGPERANLGFSDAVISGFAFLYEFGFRVVEENTTLVRYESSQAFINIYHGRASFELGIEIGNLSCPDQNVSLYEIVEYAGAAEAEGFGRHVMFQVGTQEGVAAFVPKLADLVRKYGGPFLRGDLKSYADVLERRATARTDYENDVRLSQLREKAEAAWHTKDYAQVIELYSAFPVELTEIESKRLAYAHHQLAAKKGR